jgi:NADPH:quinone reductase-like Zn-dependent oxidoreductase
MEANSRSLRSYSFIVYLFAAKLLTWELIDYGQNLKGIMPNLDQTILVAGATGNQGGTVVRHLLELGKFKVRAMVRDKNQPAAQALKQAGAELIRGGFADRASLD